MRLIGSEDGLTGHREGLRRSHRRMNRRSFLTRSCASLAAGWLVDPVLARQTAGRPDQEFLRLIGKDQRMIVHNRRPGVLETPLELLRSQILTPKDRLFVRNNQSLTGTLTLDPMELESWTVELMGLVKYPRVVDGTRLRRAPQTEVEMVLQCSGNGRSFFADSVPTRGTQWGKGGVGNVRWKGVPLAALVEELQLQIDSSARYVTAEGKDAPAVARAADFEHSLPLADVLERGLLALQMNSEPIPALHGGPVRLIVPGYYGTMNVKWLHRLRFEAVETVNYNHLPRYRTPSKPMVPGSKLDYTLENSTPTWRQAVKSLIWSPLENIPRGGQFELKGVAWNDGAVRIETVEVSADGGGSWQRAELEVPQSPYAWYPWQSRLNLPPGEHEIWARAVDASGQTQPLDGSIHWNPSGYGWRGVEKARVSVK